MGRRRRKSKPAATGIAPALLREQVANTVPFVLADDFAPRPDEPHLATVRAGDEPPLDSAAYYRLCLSAHHATVTSFVPTDVDLAIRWKLWQAMPPDEAQEAVDAVLESRTWSSARVSTRTLFGALGPLSGHHGEWFSTAAAAYGHCLRRAPGRADELGQAILAELRREAAWFDAAVAARDGHLALLVATTIAHNLGDLDRVLEQWGCHEDDPIGAQAYKLGHAPAADPSLRALYAAGELNKALMASENHRHYPLRKPRCLRRKAAFLLPIGPFFDDWGAVVGGDPSLSHDELAEVVVALIDGFDRLAPDAVGYARALRGVCAAVSGGPARLARLLPSKKARALRAGPLKLAMDEPQARFEQRMAAAALKVIDGLGVG